MILKGSRNKRVQLVGVKGRPRRKYSAIKVNKAESSIGKMQTPQGGERWLRTGSRLRKKRSDRLELPGFLDTMEN
jgi:hypothetical protein